jgi:hypothetical protein
MLAVPFGDPSETVMRVHSWRSACSGQHLLSGLGTFDKEVPEPMRVSLPAH